MNFEWDGSSDVFVWEDKLVEFRFGVEFYLGRGVIEVIVIVVVVVEGGLEVCWGEGDGEVLGEGGG